MKKHRFKKIPIVDAKALANKCGCDYVVILGVADGRVRMASYVKARLKMRNAARKAAYRAAKAAMEEINL